MKLQEAKRILYAELERRGGANQQEDRQPNDPIAEALEILLQEVEA